MSLLLATNITTSTSITTTIAILLVLLSTVNSVNQSQDQDYDDDDLVPSWPWKQSEYVTLLESREHCVITTSSSSSGSEEVVNNVTIGGKEEESLNICDPDQQLTATQHVLLHTLITHIENSTTCSANTWQISSCDLEEHEKEKEKEYGDGSGLRVGVALAKQTFQDFGSREDEFASAIRHRWRLSACDNDLIIFVSTQTHQISLSLGNRSKEVFDQTFQSIYRQIKQNFTQTNLNSKTKSAKLQIYQTIEWALLELTRVYRHQLILINNMTISRRTNITNNTAMTADATKVNNRYLSWNALLAYCSIVALLLFTFGYYCITNNRQISNRRQSIIDTNIIEDNKRKDNTNTNNINSNSTLIGFELMPKQTKTNGKTEKEIEEAQEAEEVML